MSPEDPADESPRTPGFSFSWKWLLMLGVTGLILYILIDRLSGGEEFLATLQDTDPLIVAGAFGLMIMNLGLAAARWTVIVRAMSFPLTFGRALSVILATRPFDVLVPSRGNDFLRFLGVRDIIPVVEASGSVLAQRVIDVQSICLLGFVGSIIARTWLWTAILGGGLVGAWTVVLLLFWQRERFLALPLVNRFEKKFRQLFLAFKALAQKPGHLVGAMTLSLLAWFEALAIVWVLSVATGAGIAFGDIFAYWPLSIFVGMLPLTVAGMGTRDAAFLALVNAGSAVPVAKASLVAVTIGYSVVANIFPSVLGIPFMLRVMRKLSREKAAEADQAGQADED
jgi:uncharacterized membrane protein YbhN (UPF0104 family)